MSRSADDFKVKQIGELLEALERAERLRQLLQQDPKPPDGVAETYRSVALDIYRSLEVISEDTISREQQERAYDEGRY